MLFGPFSYDAVYADINKIIPKVSIPPYVTLWAEEVDEVVTVKNYKISI
jgi:hypothetical protein